IWPIPQNSLMATYTITIDSINYVQENGYNLKQLYVGSTPFTERIGSQGFLFYFRGRLSDGDHFWKFLCYQDSTFGLEQFTANPCNYTDKVGIKEFIGKNMEVKIYPNPTSAILKVEFETSGSYSYQTELINLLGERVL